MPRFREKNERVLLNGDKTVSFAPALSKEQAYHLFYLSWHKEGDGAHPAGSVFPVEPRDLGAAREGPKAPEIRRVWSWFSDELIDEFMQLVEQDVTPMQMYEDRRKTLTVEVTVSVPNDWLAADVKNEIKDVINNVTEDTKVKVIR